jgi:hypothetical protein
MGSRIEMANYGIVVGEMFSGTDLGECRVVKASAKTINGFGWEGDKSTRLKLSGSDFEIINGGRNEASHGMRTFLPVNGRMWHPECQWKCECKCVAVFDDIRLNRSRLVIFSV